MKYLLGIDVGTSAAKVALFDTEGRLVGSSTQEYGLSQPENGWAEQDPAHWWDAVVVGIGDIVAAHPDESAAVTGIGVTGQMHGLVMLDESGAVIREAILWCDGRTIEQCAQVTERVGAKRLIAITANPALPGFTAGKILWVREIEPHNYARCSHILLPKDYIRYRLTGVLAADATDASGTNLFDVTKRQWSAEVLDALDIDPSWMPRVYESPEVVGTLSEDAAVATGLKAGIEVVAGAGDNAAAAVGLGVVSPGRAFTSIGTSGVIFAHSDTVAIDPGGRVHTFCAAAPGTWTIMSCTLAAGLSLRWWRDTFCQGEIDEARARGIDPYEVITDQIATVPVGADRLLYLPYLMGERSPLLDSNARGVFFGLTTTHSRAHLARAVMEGITFSLRQCLDVLDEMGVKSETMLACGGGARSALWRQMLADVFALPVAVPLNDEGPAFGAALLAGVGARVYDSVEDACARTVKTSVPIAPDGKSGALYTPYYELYTQLYPALAAQFSLLATLDERS